MAKTTENNPAAKLIDRAEKVGLSKDRLCEIAGCDYTTLYRWQKKLPKTLQTFVKILDTVEHFEDIQEKAVQERLAEVTA